MRHSLIKVNVITPVHQLAVHTIGAVIAPGETIMQIVPREGFGA